MPAQSSIENLAFRPLTPIFSAMASSSQTWTYDDRHANRTSRQQRLARIDTLATLLDSALVVPGTNIRFGLDAIVGLCSLMSPRSGSIPRLVKAYGIMS